MEEELINKNNKPVLLDSSTQIDIAQLESEGKTFEQIDLILDVPRGSSEYTLRRIREGVEYHNAISRKES
ncbi:hypothetical protein [Lysinibacillus xylanilyticus]|uniref:hypothetical protein n=1 Tax=Lysinibacillus xylanilyticus TaxID=582475 RepID=UPI0036D80FB3